jgi:hypothetical protein
MVSSNVVTNTVVVDVHILPIAQMLLHCRNIRTDFHGASMGIAGRGSV